MFYIIIILHYYYLCHINYPYTNQYIKSLMYTELQQPQLLPLCVVNGLGQNYDKPYPFTLNKSL